jgi:hypothetical protein
MCARHAAGEVSAPSCGAAVSTQVASAKPPAPRKQLSFSPGSNLAVARNARKKMDFVSSRSGGGGGGGATAAAPRKSKVHKRAQQGQKSVRRAYSYVPAAYFEQGHRQTIFCWPSGAAAAETAKPAGRPRRGWL